MPSLPPPNESIAELVDVLGEADTKEIVRSFLREFPVTLRQINSIERTEAHRLAHGLKSSARHVGAQSLSRRMGALEAQLGQPGGEIAADELAFALADFEQVAGPLKKYANS